MGGGRNYFFSSTGKFIRRSSSFNTGRIDHLFNDPEIYGKKLFLHYGDLTDSSNLNRLLEKTEPDEIYNLGAQSHVQVSFEVPKYTAEVDGVGVLRFLDAIKKSYEWFINKYHD